MTLANAAGAVAVDRDSLSGQVTSMARRRAWAWYLTSPKTASSSSKTPAALYPASSAAETGPSATGALSAATARR